LHSGTVAQWHRPGSLRGALCNYATVQLSNWLKDLPHQIPFRAASAVRRLDDKTIEGVFVCTANDFLTAEIMVVEAMAQFAGGLAFREQGFLTGIDRCEVLRPIVAGDAVEIRVTLEVAFGGTFRFSGVGHVDGVEAVRGRFYLAAPHADP
jgi:3-hydroxymyristoyl/3-hydroxydecanoyl-(acyl carrier protein) dehydratase